MSRQNSQPVSNFTLEILWYCNFDGFEALHLPRPRLDQVAFSLSKVQTAYLFLECSTKGLLS